MSITTLLNTIAIPKKYPKPTRRSALSKYKLEYETYEQEQKIWRASTAKNKAQRTLHHRVQPSEMVGLLRKRFTNFRRRIGDK